MAYTKLACWGESPLRRCGGGEEAWCAHRVDRLPTKPKAQKLTSDTLPNCGMEENGRKGIYRERGNPRLRGPTQATLSVNLRGWWAPGPGNGGWRSSRVSCWQ